MGARVKADPAIEEDELVKVWKINWSAVQAFLALKTQWRVSSLSTMDRARVVHLGLDYAAIEPTLRLSGIKRSKRLFAQLQVLESQALEAFVEAAG